MTEPYVITIASEKGGVGKTTVATNLAIYLKALTENTPVTLFSFDNHFTVDQMFQLEKNPADNHVGHLFTGTPMNELALTGQYGVDYIRSNSRSFEFLKHVTSVDSLAQVISESPIEGIVIIDTSPVLDKYTCNAMHAADRVIVPIKDAPSLENSQHLADFIAEHNRPRSILKILPCLIDTRIRFEGPFRNSYQLLKAYAINRGYRCYEGFISKSPKVETLGTNPSGKIYPVITHARNTDVHLQLAHLARQVYLDFLEQGPRRLIEIVAEQTCRDKQMTSQYKERQLRLQPGCLCCDSGRDDENLWPNAYFLESSEGDFSGYIEDECFFQLLLNDCYPELSGKKQQDLLRDLLNSPAHGETLLFHQRSDDIEKTVILIQRLDREGGKLAEKSITLKKSSLFKKQSTTRLLDLFSRATALNNDNRTLLARRMGNTPLEALQHQHYHAWRTLFNRAMINLHGDLDTAETSDQ